MNDKIAEIMNKRTNERSKYTGGSNTSGMMERCSVVGMYICLLVLGHFYGEYSMSEVGSIGVFIVGFNVIITPILSYRSRNIVSSAARAGFVLMMSEVIIILFMYSVRANSSRDWEKELIEMAIISLIYSNAISRVVVGSIGVIRTFVTVSFMVGIGIISFISFFVPPAIDTLRNEKLRKFIGSGGKVDEETKQKIRGVFSAETLEWAKDKIGTIRKEEVEKTFDKVASSSYMSFLGYAVLKSIFIPVVALMIVIVGRGIHRSLRVLTSGSQKSRIRLLVEYFLMYFVTICVVGLIAATVFDMVLRKVAKPETEGLLNKTTTIVWSIFNTSSDD